jgi:hypothetical protein
VPDDVRLSDIEERFTRVCGKRGADVRPDFSGADDGVSAESQVVVICASLYCRVVAYVR